MMLVHISDLKWGERGPRCWKYHVDDMRKSDVATSELSDAACSCKMSRVADAIP